MREGVGALRLVGRRARFYMLHAGRLSSPPSLTAVHPEDTYPPNTLELPFRASFVRAAADYPDYPASYRSRCLKATTPIAVTTIHPLLTHRPLPPPDFSTFHDAAVAATASSVSRRRYYPPDRLCLPRCSTRDEGLPYLMSTRIALPPGKMLPPGNDGILGHCVATSWPIHAGPSMSIMYFGSLDIMQPSERSPDDDDGFARLRVSRL